MAGTDCSACPDAQSCDACNETLHAGGVQLYTALAQCVICQSCYTSCGGAMTGGFCPSPPMPSPCDGAAGGTSCDTCQSCSIGGECAAAWNACMNDPQCSALIQGFEMCPQN
jgi:hypothetical protein